jgi:hypothetical protein
LHSTKPSTPKRVVSGLISPAVLSYQILQAVDGKALWVFFCRLGPSGTAVVLSYSVLINFLKIE